MRFLELTVGGSNLQFAMNNVARVPFSFPGPVRSIHAMLQSFSFRKSESDMELRSLKILLTPALFSTSPEATGEVLVVTEYSDSEPILVESRLIEMEIRILLVAEN